jgi:hypothetical protein
MDRGVFCTDYFFLAFFAYHGGTFNDFALDERVRCARRNRLVGTVPYAVFFRTVRHFVGG